MHIRKLSVRRLKSQLLTLALTAGTLLCAAAGGAGPEPDARVIALTQQQRPASTPSTATESTAQGFSTAVNAVRTAKATGEPASIQVGAVQVVDKSGVQIAARTDVTPRSDTATAAPDCVIDQTRYFGGSCWANVKDTVPNGTNRSYANARLNHTGSVNANCIAGKVLWSTGLCKANSASSMSAASPDSTTTRAPNGTYKIGTFYFPGWKSNQKGAPAKLPWERLKSYPEREPMLAWYDDGSVDVVEQQLKWMHKYGIGYVVFDWYWNGKDTELGHSVDAYLKTHAKQDVPFALLWANHSSVPRTKLEFTSMVDYWIAHYFNQPEFLKIDGKPVIFIFSHQSFVKQAAQIGLPVAALLADAEGRARAAGHKGIYFVAGTHLDSSLLKVANTFGYSALSAYNYHGSSDDSSISYEELNSAYQHVWNGILTQSAIPYIVPMTQGWDKRPWGGSTNPLHDLSGGVLTEFERHLMEARKLMDANPAKTMNMGVICCWNEFGEGSFIEPTKKGGFSYLEVVQKVFGPR